MSETNTHSLHMWPSVFNNFSKLTNKVGEVVYSSPYQIGSYEFRIWIYPGGNTEDDKDWIAMYLELCKPVSTPICIRFRLSILNHNKTKIVVANPKGLVKMVANSKKDNPRGVSKAMLRSDLMEQVLKFTDDQLIVLSEILAIDRPEFLNFLPKPCNHEEYVNNEKLSDVKIIMKGKTIHAHKILMSTYRVFAAMFEHNMKESTQNIIDVDDIEFDVMLELIRFIYTGKIHGMEMIAQDLLIAADKYDICELKDQCSKYLCCTLSIHNVLQLMNFANKYNDISLEKASFAYFLNHRKDVGKLHDFEKTLENLEEPLKTRLIVVLTNS
ncbi:hypothetical protein QAD02_011094 [Eretmocerus hayati]|uniref:Uncharacterized protein n=1 Tax=Eretmocerus hayati TaxID=131215 RepID=A0ACC2NVS9_9HYME|nr:hypothetical protein QAD02_011094 [Eretmocerus hayati]